MSDRQRVVSLLPSATEILHFVGAGDLWLASRTSAITLPGSRPSPNSRVLR
ncbi:MAG TPA: hypothetical protein VI027_02980 [Rubrobacteraceae bacterium]